MALESYYEPFFVQKLVEKESPFPPPWDAPISVLEDGEGIVGIFKQQQSGSALIAAAQGVATVGRFACDSSLKLEPNTIVRRVSDGTFFRLIGTPLTSPLQADTQVSTWVSQTINRGDVESDTGENNGVNQ